LSLGTECLLILYESISVALSVQIISYWSKRGEVQRFLSRVFGAARLIGMCPQILATNPAESNFAVRARHVVASSVLLDRY
jgi:hypothetical protein